jgi:ATP-dependent helicase/nuclease subunit B
MSGVFDRPAPRWFTIGAERPFLDDLARGIVSALGGGGEDSLAEAVILMPTRRAARGLAHALLGAAPTSALLLPQIRVIGDLDEGEPPFESADVAIDLPPAISAWRRRFELAGLVAEHQRAFGRRIDASQVLALADALAAFLDGCEIEEVDPAGKIETLVEGDLAGHWRQSADFLNVAVEAWPARLRQLGLMDVAERRVALLRGLAEQWRANPPTRAVIAAGSTGSAPSSADLLKVIAEAPRGCVVLPGLDADLAESAWTEIGEPHPQFTLSRLLARAGVSRAEVPDWPPVKRSGAGRWRRRLINEALRPPGETADWIQQIKSLRAETADAEIDPIAEGLAGLSVVTARTEEEAATVAALLLREALAVDGMTAALISPDAGLARRVSARLSRWGVTADSSAGKPLAGAPAAVLAGLVARLLVDPADPVTLLAAFKHPLARFGRSDDLDGARYAIERYALRGARPSDLDAVVRRLRDRSAPDLEGAVAMVEAARDAIDPARALFDGGAATAAEAARALTTALEALCADGSGTPGALWSGLGGEGLAGVLQALIAESAGLPEVTRAGFADLLQTLLAGETIRAGGASHPRLQILGVLEARLVRADRLILAGLEEGSWPAATPIDPFLSRPMRVALGLPPPERRIGLSAHDFAQAASAPEVILLHAERRGGAPAIASRWLWRLSTLVEGADLNLPRRDEVLDWARAIDAPLADPPDRLKTATRPKPTPPFASRPRELPVTDIERWVRDPYGLYAKRILGLRPMERPDEPVEARARGNAVHEAFQKFVEAHPGELPPDAHERFTALLVAALETHGMPPARMAREQTLAARMSTWALAFEQRRRPGAELFVEVKGAYSFETPRGRFTVTARADRIEARGGSADVLDFKTGQPPSRKMVEAGFSPQLTLTGAILAAGGFETIQRRDTGDLVYVRVTGGRTPGQEIAPFSGGASALIQAAIAGLRRRVEAYDDEATPYLSWAAPQFMGRFGGDYDHLARLWEWHVVGDFEGEA